jgi:hypothetical protein
MPIQTAVSESPDPQQAAAEIGAALGPAALRAVLFFASSRYEPAALARAVQETFPSVLTFGCTTAGEIGDGRMLEGALVAMALPADGVERVEAVFIEDPAEPASTRAALDALGGRFGALSSLDPARHVGLVLQDGMRGTEETVMEVLSSAVNVPFIGGSAGDDAAFQKTYTFLNGVAREGAAVLALLRPTRPFVILKTQSFDVTDTVLTATDVDEATRTIRTLDGKPAAQAYADALGVSVAELPDHFMRHPLGLVLPGGEPFVRSPQQVRGTDVVFYCSVKSGMRLHVLRSRDIVEDTRRDLEATLGRMGTCSGIVNFHCILRTAELVAKGQQAAYGALFTRCPTIGFSTYGESYVGHINQTSTLLLFG